MDYQRNPKDYKSHINHLYNRANNIINEFNHTLIFNDDEIHTCYGLNNLTHNEATYIKMFLSDILWFDYNYSPNIKMRRRYNRIEEYVEYDFMIWAEPRVDE